jgi:hypothetical protein
MMRTCFMFDRFWFRYLPFSLVMFFTASPLLAVEVQTWSQHTAADFENGKQEGIVVTSQSRVELARQLTPRSDLGITHVWALAREADGSIVAATGGPGLVVRVSPDGAVAKLHESTDQQIFALAVDKDGTIFYGVSPNGEIFKRTRDGNVQVFFATEETYIWGLAIDASGAVLAATGPQGRLYRIGPDGKGTILFQAKQKHLLSMALGPNGMTYLGTSNDGLIYRVDPEGKGFVLYDAPQADVHAILLDERGRLYAGTGTPERPTFPAGVQRQQRRFPFELLFPAAAVSFLGPLAPVADAPTPAPSPAPARLPARANIAASGENSVYRIAVDGQVDEIFRERCLVLSLALQGENLLVGTGQEGKLYSVDLNSQVKQTLARLESGQIQSMFPQPDGSVVIGTGVPGKIWVVENKYTGKGILESSIFDAKLQTRWGKGAWQGNVPTGAKLIVEFRSGNVEKPDETWANWTADASTLPLSRFMQYRATLESPDGRQSPSLSDVSAYYATINRPPMIDSLDVPNLINNPIADASAKLEIRWKATDPNSDKMVYDLDVLKEGWPDWVAVAREHAGNDFKWDPGSMPSGIYRFRVTASDAPSNRQGDKLSAIRVSDPFNLDRDPPAVVIASAKQVGKKIEVSTSAKDGQTRLTAAAYSLNGIDWWPLFPDDGLFDSSEEVITFQTEERTSGSYLLLVRFRDSAGHLGVADTVVRVE